MIRRKVTSRRRGFTLIESMATVSVLAVLGSITSFLILDAVDGFTDAATTAQLHAEMSIAMDRVTRELRKIELDGAAAGIAPDITNMTANQLDWEDSAGDQYQLVKSGSTLMLKVDGGPSSTLLTDVSALSISIWDEDDASVGASCSGAGCDDVRRITVEVTCQRDGVTESLRSNVFIRSTMSGAG